MVAFAPKYNEQVAWDEYKRHSALCETCQAAEKNKCDWCLVGGKLLDAVGDMFAPTTVVLFQKWSKKHGYQN